MSISSVRILLAVYSVYANSQTINVDDSFGEGLRSFLRQVVADAASDETLFMLARELIAICCAVEVNCTVGVAFHGDSRHADGRKHGQSLFQIVVFPLAVCRGSA
jgi:hypothetical protein